MPYLKRRIQKLITDIESGNTRLLSQPSEKLTPELRKVRYLEDGEIDLASCTPNLRAYAHAYYMALQGLNEESDIAPNQTSRMDSGVVDNLNLSLFELYEDLFEAGTGTPPSRFTRDGEDFDIAMMHLRNRFLTDKKFAKRASKKLGEAMERLQSHYVISGNTRLDAAAQSAGLKLVLGGAQGFTKASLQAAKSMLLYCDSLLIPDPIHRWFEITLVQNTYLDSGRNVRLS